MKKESARDQRLNWLLPMALEQMSKEAAAIPAPTRDDLHRADRAFETAMRMYFHPMEQSPDSSDVSRQGREKE